MAIDYVIDYDCIPKQTFGTDELKERMKGRERANIMIQLYRENGDERPASEIGFEFTRQSPQGEEETRLVIVQDLIDAYDEIAKVSHHCRHCPANRLGTAFGCMSFVQYPISGKAEAWLLDQLPSINEPLIWLLLKQGIENLNYDGKAIAILRQTNDNYFEDKLAAQRFLGEFMLGANQVFEMIFAVGDIIPNHGAVLLLFYNAIERSELEAPEIMTLAPANEGKILKYPFLHQVMPHDDKTIAEFKEFFHALYIAWALNVKLLIEP